MKDPRVIDRKDLKRMRNGYYHDYEEAIITGLLDYIDLLHELVDPIQTAFLEREQERMGWKAPIT